MDDQYLDAFIRESEEEITKLNNHLLELEADPDDREAMDQIFRTAHTLKGNFGAMGFEDAADLSHAVEDLLDAMREGSVAVTPEAMDLIFAGVDRIEAIVGDIEEHGESSLSTGDIVSDLREIEAGADTGAGGDAGPDAGGDPEAAGEDGGPGDRGDPEALVDREAAVEAASVDPEAVTDRVVHAGVELAETEMPGVDAMLAVERVEEALTVLDTVPDRATIEDGDHGGTFSLLLDAADLGRVDTELDAVAQIASARATDVTAETLGEATDGTAEGGPGDGDAGGDGPTDDHGVDDIRSVRVDVDQLDDLHGLVEQLVTSRIKLRRAIDGRDVGAAGDTLDELDKITANLQNTVMDMRLIPLRKVVGKFPRMVRDLARELDKEIDFEVEGEDIELDRTILTEISDPLMHIIRNAVDHGVEAPADRERQGKPRAGQVTLRATRERDHVTVQVVDDGRGLDAEEIRRQAAEQGVRTPEELEAMDDGAVYDLVFHPGFSTADEVTDVSGRGVGMDVVHETVTQLDGSVDVSSTPGEGTTVSLRLPVTMAIVKVLFVEVGDEEYGVPIKNVDEITGVGGVERINGEEVIKHDGELYPVIDLAERFGVSGAGGEARAATDGGTAADDAGTTAAAGAAGDGMLVRIRESERQVALRCDAVNAQEEVVVKPLEGLLSGTPGLSGTAVLGDGNIVHILDVVTL